MIKINHMVEIVVHATEKAVYVYKFGMKPTVGSLFAIFFKHTSYVLEAI